MNSLAVRIWQAPQGLIGIGLIAVFWPLNWVLDGFRTAYLFFPLWLGYILIMDALVLVRTGTSILTRSRQNFVLLFVVSAPAWWLFEVINWRTQNWTYLGRTHFSNLQYFLLASLSFSTVMPAVFETAEWVRSFAWINRFAAGPALTPTRNLFIGFFVVGLAMLSLTMIWPAYFYPLVWGSLVMLLEPINYWLGRRHFLQFLQKGDWRPVLALSSGALLCGFFWEMWNFYSFPKWVYDTPGAEFLYIFEMPLLGYLGYIPFAWELYSIRNFLWPNAPELKI